MSAATGKPKNMGINYDIEEAPDGNLILNHPRSKDIPVKIVSRLKHITVHHFNRRQIAPPAVLALRSLRRWITPPHPRRNIYG